MEPRQNIHWLYRNMANVNILEAIEDEDLGSVRRWLNSNTGRANINRVLNSGKTVLNRALAVAANYSARNTFAHRIVALLRERGAHTAEELEAPSTPPLRTNIFEGFNYSGTNIFGSSPNEYPSYLEFPPAKEQKLHTKPPLAPRLSQPSRKLNGIAFGPRRSRRNSRTRKTRRRRN